MAEERIVITIDEDGSIKAKTEGLKGEVCMTELEEILSDDVMIKSVKKTDEYYQERKIVAKNIQKQGVKK